MYRTIWSYYFITGLLSVTAGVPAMDSWAATLLPADGAGACQLAGNLAAFSRSDMALCLASWITEGRILANAGLSILADAHHGMPLAGWLRVMDVVVIAAGVVAALVALAWLWAGAMTRFAGLSLAGTYTLVRAVGIALEPRRPG